MPILKLFLVGTFALLFVSAYLFNAHPLRGHAQTGTLAPPDGVTASDDAYSTKIGVYWNPVPLASTYTVFRSATAEVSTAVSVGTTAANYFFDSSAEPGQKLFYWVKAANGVMASELGKPDEGSRAPGLTTFDVPPLAPPSEPLENPVTAAKAFLGKTLFWDEQLSSTKTVSCGTCHQASNGGSDLRTALNRARSLNPGPDGVFGTGDDIGGSRGVPANQADGTYVLSETFGFREQTTPRRSQSHINSAYPRELFWDGRARSAFRNPLDGTLVSSAGQLENQVLQPFLETTEMAHAGRTWSDVVARVSASKPLAVSPAVPRSLRNWISGRGYPALFADAFGTSEITPVRIAQAIASYERTLFSDQTPFDKSISQIAPLTDAEQRGRNIFGGSSCSSCHQAAIFSDHNFHNIGVRPQTDDAGRFEVTSNPADRGRFRTPSLRNVELRAPYMHNGRFSTLEEVVEFYNRGGDFAAANIDPARIRPLNLSAQQKSDLVAFLKRPLTDPRVRLDAAPFDRPRLYSESRRVPEIVGTGVTGSGGIVPQPVAIEPPLSGNPSFTVAVDGALGGAQATLVIDETDPGVGPDVPPTGTFARVSIQLSGSGAGGGHASVPLSIPANSQLVGKTFFGRWYIADPGSQSGLAVTPSFKFTVFGEAAPTVRITGRVTYADGRGLRLSRVILTAPNGEIRFAITNPFGYFHFSELPTGETVSIAVDAKNRTFTEPTKAVLVSDEEMSVNFTVVQ